MQLITITGSSSAGKDTVARMLSEMTGIPVLCSYTTRQKRDGEMNGREHYFVKECNVPQSPKRNSTLTIPTPSTNISPSD